MPDTFSEDPPIALVAARMSSTRLPSKPLIEFGGKALLSHVVSATANAEGICDVVVVTSDQPSDDAVEDWCISNRVKFWRGDLSDVAGRMLGAATHYGSSSFVRISGDSPMIDPTIIAFAVSQFLSKKIDLVTNVNPRNFPPGQSVEVVRVEALEHLLRAKKNHPGDREHVTPILYRHEEQVTIDRFTPLDVAIPPSRLSGPYRSMAIDTPNDADCFQRFVSMEEDPYTWKLGWQRCGMRMHAAQLQMADDRNLRPTK